MKRQVHNHFRMLSRYPPVNTVYMVCDYVYGMYAALQEWRGGSSGGGSSSVGANTVGAKTASTVGVRVIVARPPHQRMRCSTPEHEKAGVKTLYASRQLPQQGPLPQQMAMLHQQVEGRQQYGAYKPPTGAAGLGAGGVDEEANRREFRAAMSDWRSRKGPIKIVYE